MADKIIFKRSSILGKRPTRDNLEPGELGINTNSEEPGLFFSTTDGRTIKAGPTAVLPLSPTGTPERGEAWLNTERGTLNVGDAENEWRAIAAPYLGGGGSVVFVAPEFTFSSDSILNDGQTLPFQTVTRALLEYAKKKVRNKLLGDLLTDDEKKFVIYVSSSTVTPNNEPGTPVELFSTVFEERASSEVLTEELIQFNAGDGGIVIPGGVTIKGLDLKKSRFKPTYIPSYRHPGYPAEIAGMDEPLSTVFKAAGNCYCESFSFEDKQDLRNVSEVYELNTLAAFRSPEPHGLSFNDKVSVTFSSNVDRSTGTFKGGTYYVRPLNTFDFQLCTASLEGENSFGEYIKFSSLPLFEPFSEKKFIVTNKLRSSHRLSGIKYASKQELADYYTKVQKAFPVYFGGRVVDGLSLVEESEYVIVAPSEVPFPENLATNSTRNSSCHIDHVSLRSDYGMAFGDFDGDEVSGFRSLIANECTAVSIQKDPAAYEIYTVLNNPLTGKTEQRWWTLAEATFHSLPLSSRPERIDQVTDEEQLRVLNQTPIENIRYYFEELKNSEGQGFGIANINRDFRHFGFRARNSAYMQAQSIYTIGTAIGVWSLNGAFIHLTNSTSNFGSVAFKSEGFLGINTIGGAYPNLKNFLFTGVQRPLALSKAQVLDDSNKKILSLGSRIVESYVDPLDPYVQILKLSSNFLPCYILPYSLKPGTAVWVSSEHCTYRGFLVDDGGPTVLLGNSTQCDQTARLRIRYSDSTIPTDASTISSLDIPYIRRFLDPRSPSDRSYQFVLSNTSTEAIPPPVGSVLRLNQTGQAIGTSSLKPNVQFDPGSLGGWGRLFTVDSVQTAAMGLSPNYNNIVGNHTQDSSYMVTITVSDTAGPWINSPDRSRKLPQGSYCTYANKNWYVAENDLWDSTYYDVEFSETVSERSVAPVESCSPFVVSSSLERQYPVSSSFQGSYAQDANLSLLSGDELTKYTQGTYLRGSTIPYSEYAIQGYFDWDDGTDSMGLLIKDIKSNKSTVLVSPIDSNAAVQKDDLPMEYGSVRTHSEYVEFAVMSSASIVNPKQDISILRLEQGTKFEYLRVVSLVGTRVVAMRLDQTNSFFPNPEGGSNANKPVWVSTSEEPVIAYICETNPTPVPAAYDPDWAHTKYGIYRFFEVMGYSNSYLRPLLLPQYWGERFLPVESINVSPLADGYATTTTKWPLEFNQPSTIIANTHSWSNCGYPFYSQGLPKYQTTEISRKLNYDFLCTTLWSGRLTVTGINEKGELVFFGPQREAVTSQYYTPVTPDINLATQQIFNELPFTEFPGQVVAYIVDDISDQFNGERLSFPLRKSGFEIPLDHASALSTWVQLGGVTQKPYVNYVIQGNYILFSEPPVKDTHCDIRIVTSEDKERTLVSVNLELKEGQEFDGLTSIFTLVSDSRIDELDINAYNTIVILGGVEQLPLDSYLLTRVSPTEMQITFTGTPPKGCTFDCRAICSGNYWTSQGVYPVAVYSLDNISPEFQELAQTTFELKYDGKPINPDLVNNGNLIVNIGGVMQLPVTEVDGVRRGSYEVIVSPEGKPLLKLREPPKPGTLSDLRIITNSEFLPCSAGTSREDFMRWGPSLVLQLEQRLEDLQG